MSYSRRGVGVALFVALVVGVVSTTDDTITTTLPPTTTDENLLQDLTTEIPTEEPEELNNLKELEDVELLENFEESVTERYLNYDEISQLLNRMVNDYKDVCRLVEIGRTFEDRPIYMLQISNNFRANKPVVAIEAGLHAREWIAPAVALNIALQIIKRDTHLLGRQDWHIVPCANPDGYQFTHTTNRFWRKNRSRNVYRLCNGTDLNRNFDVNWGEAGSSSIPCDPVYRGDKPFSESETRALRDAFSQERHRMRVYLSLHSYGQQIVIPNGYSTNRLSRKTQNVMNCGKNAGLAIAAVTNTNYTVGFISTLLYLASGTSDNYMLMNMNVPYVYTIELPGGGRTGFDLPPRRIRRVVKEIFVGIKVLATCWHIDK